VSGCCQTSRRGFEVKKSLFSAWGRHVDDELVGVAPVVLNLACVVPNEPDIGEVWGNATPRQFLVNKADMQAFAQARWSPESSVHVWEVPSLRFDTVHGSVVVADTYNESQFAFLRSKEGRRALRLNAPLRNVAALIHWAEATPGEEGYPEFFVAAIGWRETESLTRASLRHYVAFAPEVPGDSPFEWGWMSEDVDSSGVRAARKVFVSVNTKEARDEAMLLWEQARAARAETDGVDVHAGIADLEIYLDGLN
jgi:hypothetical protein